MLEYFGFLGFDRTSQYMFSLDEVNPSYVANFVGKVKIYGKVSTYPPLLSKYAKRKKNRYQGFLGVPMLYKKVASTIMNSAFFVWVLDKAK